MVRLDPEQEDLLATIVDLVRSVPRNERDSFLLLELNGVDFLSMQGAQTRPVVLSASADVRALENEGLLRRAPGGSRNTTPYDVTREGFDYYEELKRSAGGPIEAVEADVRRYLDAEDFASRHRESSAKWRQAEEEMWGEDTESRMTSVGHHLREAMMAFAAEVMERYGVAGALSDPEKTVDRLRAIIAEAKPRLGDTEAPMLEALVVYWGTVSDLAHRQEHGAAKSAPLVAEDARRVVFQSAIVMFELDRAFVRAFGR